MSYALRIASVSYVLIDLINNGLVNASDFSTTGVGDVIVTALPPDVVDHSDQTKNRLNLFLYQVTPNQGWRNEGLPSLDGNGARIDNPPLALDLHYLLTAYGISPLNAEIMLGYAMQLLHETPVLTRQYIRDALAAPVQVPGGGGPPETLQLFSSELAEQIEQIKIWPQIFTLEEISKLWMAFQARYRPTAAYHASVVLIPSRASTITAPPVRRRHVQTLALQQPVITSVASQSAANQPIVANQPILIGYNVVLIGTQLVGEDTVVLVGGLEVYPSAASSTQIIFALPSQLLAGGLSVQIAQRSLLGSPPEPHRIVESNATSFTYSPTVQTITASGVTTASDGTRSGTFTVTVAPPVGPEQQVTLLLNQIAPVTSPPATNVPAYSVVVPPRIDLASPPASPPAPTPTLTIPFVGVVSGAYVVRLVVDGAISPMGSDPVTGLYSTPSVVIP